MNFDNFYDAYLSASKKVKYKSDVLRVSENVELVIHDIIDRLNAGTWVPDEYTEFELRTEVKRRIIHAPSFRTHHAIVQVIG